MSSKDEVEREDRDERRDKRDAAINAAMVAKINVETKVLFAKELKLNFEMDLLKCEIVLARKKLREELCEERRQGGREGGLNEALQKEIDGALHERSGEDRRDKLNEILNE